MSDEAIENTITATDETAAEPVEDACGCKGDGKDGCRCKGHGPKRCPIRRCPVKALTLKGNGKDGESCNALGAAVSVVIMAATVALSVYAQYVLTKWAVKDAVREMGHGRH
ncbi:hypothetical protein JS528_03655 [Bifidobacterium sp. MA2]|uniref:Uncharacterized protein n=1 Tax=Bifidobacterium santillanense TaxID=2809028 RepID=A0ABS5UNH2_9BIFI|nr:hypothetical protein [Bifidobacterium santillanense]MBT1172470.1 hypothetical protein [Bifidobacterium santillanense]